MLGQGHSWPLTLALLATFIGCERAPLDSLCPEISVGDLVITELRPKQETGMEWIELYNSSSQTIRLQGLDVSVIRLDGSSERNFIVRDESMQMTSNQFVILDPKQNNVDDDSQFLYDTGAIRLTTCGNAIDTLAYQNLPTEGTQSIDGALTPTADANDDPSSWCNLEENLSGTPGMRNESCDF